MFFKQAEIHYTCAWTTDPVTNDPIISVSGVKGIIRTIVPFKSTYKRALIGHGGSINDLKYHPSKWSILLSSSRDHTLRLWNIDTGVCIAIFGGVEGHRDEVLSGVGLIIRFSKVETNILFYSKNRTLISMQLFS